MTRPVPNVLFIDNFDSFTFNLVDELRRRGAQVEVWRHDMSAERALELALSLPEPRLIMLSPGPGRPEDAGCCEELVRLSLGQVPLFGVCLGFQAIVQALGGRVEAAGEVVHGKTSLVEHDGQGIFIDQPSPLQVGRYHSLAAFDIPAVLEVSARCGDTIMGVRHREALTEGVQFHPESILTPRGGLMIAAFLRAVVERADASSVQTTGDKHHASTS